MQQALHLAKEGMGVCAPNPNVGCVIVKEGKVIGAARTANSGRPHAETQALEKAGTAAQGATAYVTLEPCAHHGKTPPCAEALVQAGISHVVIACIDPDTRVSGLGIQILQQAGIQVTTSLCEAEAIEMNRGFFSRIQRNRPWVTLKTATTADGFIAREDGSSQWITGEAARIDGHYLRARNDAILTGSGTYLFDHPQLNVRIKGLEAASPKRYVLDRSGRVTDSDFILCRQPTLSQLLTEMAEEGVNYLMVEAGASLSQAFLEQGLIDELYWYRAPKIRFEQGIQAFHGAWDHTPSPTLIEERKIDEDELTVYRFTSLDTFITQG